MLRTFSKQVLSAILQRISSMQLHMNLGGCRLQENIVAKLIITGTPVTYDQSEVHTCVGLVLW